MCTHLTIRFYGNKMATMDNAAYRTSRYQGSIKTRKDRICERKRIWGMIIQISGDMEVVASEHVAAVGDNEHISINMGISQDTVLVNSDHKQHILANIRILILTCIYMQNNWHTNTRIQLHS